MILFRLFLFSGQSCYTVSLSPIIFLRSDPPPVRAKTFSAHETTQNAADVSIKTFSTHVIP